MKERGGGGGSAISPSLTLMLVFCHQFYVSEAVADAEELILSVTMMSCSKQAMLVKGIRNEQ